MLKLDLNTKPKCVIKHGKFPRFEDIKVSTKTFIVVTNLTLNIEKLFETLNLEDWTIIHKKRGRKKKSVVENPNNNKPDGSIISLEYENKIRGVDLKKKKKKKKNTKKRGNYFRNSLTVIMIIDNKRINFKISRNGKFQITGCKFDLHAEKIVKFLWHFIKDNNELYELRSETNSLFALFVPAMRNIDFSLGFKVDREKLDEYFNSCTEYFSLLETSFGYTGVNIKIPLKYDLSKLSIKKIVFDEKTGWEEEKNVFYNDYLNLLTEKERIKKQKKQKYNTFLVFHSGKCIMSGMKDVTMRGVYYLFLDIIANSYDIIREKLTVDEN